MVTPSPRGARQGNRVTAERWARLLRQLSHKVDVLDTYGNEACDLLIALHAYKSSDSVQQFARRNTGRPLIVALTGTDVYEDIRSKPEAMSSLYLASRIAVLQPLAADELPAEIRPKVRSIIQSARPPGCIPLPLKQAFEVCVSGHLRPVKDPFRTAEAVRDLPPNSRIRVTQIGEAMSADMADQARNEMRINPRYHWLGNRSHGEALRILARSRVLALTSILEGGANVVSEAIACGVPVVSSKIPGSIGLLGQDYPGYFEVGDTKGLRSLLLKCETNTRFYSELKSKCEALQPLVSPEQELSSWRELISELA